MRSWLLLVPLVVALAGACGSNTATVDPPPSVVTFDLRNDGTPAVYLNQPCLLDFTITSLAEPVHQIVRQGACACDCTLAACPVCGPCLAGTHEIVGGTSLETVWAAVSVTHEPRALGTCERKHTLPAGSYRIDVPVYPTAADALAEPPMNARTASQSFVLPAPDGTVVTVAIGASP